MFIVFAQFALSFSDWSAQATSKALGAKWLKS